MIGYWKFFIRRQNAFLRQWKASEISQRVEVFMPFCARAYGRSKTSSIPSKRILPDLILLSEFIDDPSRSKLPQDIMVKALRHWRWMVDQLSENEVENMSFEDLSVILHCLNKLQFHYPINFEESIPFYPLLDDTSFTKLIKTPKKQKAISPSDLDPTIISQSPLSETIPMDF